MSLGLDAESRAHIVITVNHVVIVTFCAAEENAAQEDALFQLMQGTHLRKAQDDAWAEGCRLRDAVRGERRAVFHRFRIIIVEMLEDTGLYFQLVSSLDAPPPQPSEKMQSVDEGLVGRHTERQLHVEEIVGLGVFGIHHVAILQEQIHIGIEFSTE